MATAPKKTATKPSAPVAPAAPKEMLSPHFSLAEMTATQTGLPNVPSAAQKAALIALCNTVLEPIRAKFGPVRVTSGFRSRAVNMAVRGSASSQHCNGEAADIEVRGVSNYELALWISNNLKFDQLILEFYTPGDPNSGWVHVSFRTTWNRGQVMTAQRVKGKTVYKAGLLR